MRFPIAWFTLICLIASANSSPAQVIDVSEMREDQLVSLELSPTEPVRPSLAIRLFPAANELFDRNAAIYYHRAIYSLNTTEERFRANQADPDLPDTFDNRFLEPNMDAQTIRRLRVWLNGHQNMLRELQYATHSKNCDWQLIPEEAKDNWFLIMVPELDGCRGIARLLAAKARLEIIDGNYDQAIETIRAGFKMASDLHESEILVGSLCAYQSVGLMLQPLTELIEMPDSPNLFWAFATLPDDLTDNRETIRLELNRLRTGLGFELLDDPDKPRTMRSWRKAFSQYSDRLTVLSAIMGSGYTMPANAVYSYPIAKQMMINGGVSVEEVEAMPAIQVVALMQAKITEQLIDEYEKGLSLSDLKGIDYFEKLEKRMREESFNGFHVSESSLVPHLDILLLPLQQTYQTNVLLKRRIAALQVLEAIRLHLEEKGNLPHSLDEIKGIPVPVNAATEKPFRYESDGQSAKLYALGRLPIHHMIYQITVKGK